MFIVLHLRSAHKITDREEMHIPGLAPDIYSFMKFVFTIFFMTLGFFFLMQCQCTNFVDEEEEDDFFDAERSFDVHLRYLNYRDRDRDSDSNPDTTDTDRYTDTDTDTDRDYYPIGPIPSAPPVRDYYRIPPTAPPVPVPVSCLSCGNFATKVCSRCKVARYCSKTCQSKHWEKEHRSVCKEYTPPGNIGSAHASSSEGRSPRHRVNGVPTRTTRSSKRKSGKEHWGVVEKCPICLTAIRTYKHSRASLSCVICNQKFHSLCIFRWFSISKKSTCPCCRSTFQSAGSATGQSSSSSK